MNSSPSVSKILQRKVYDVLSSRYGLFSVFLGLVVLVSSAFFFGEAIVEWSGEKYASVFNSFSDNLLGKSFRTRLCLPVPIDVVYTWVNGTDPLLLAELRKAKASVENQLNNMTIDQPIIMPDQCTYANCIKAPMLIFPLALSDHLTLEKLKHLNAKLRKAYRLETVESDDSLSNFTMLHFDSVADAEEALNRSFTVDGTQLVQGFYASDVTIPHSRLLHSLVLVSGFKKKYAVESVKGLLPQHIRSLILEIAMDEFVGLFRARSPSDATILLQMQYNFTLDDRYLQFNLANIVYDLKASRTDQELSASRFADNEELRYSLRSLEQYAPWVRHIYLVTNGQIPYWLNMDNSRLTIITHEDIFPNKSHLPTFSSPAIESHLHRITGLSDKFLYLNDDVMFGAPVWPDDFYTHSKGQKVYLAWSIPDCAPGCPHSWIKDGYCDRACNVSECNWDAGDCANGVQAYSAGSHWNQPWNQRGPDSAITFCHVGCSNTWIADKYCDQACNVKECGFDAGDCGINEYHQLHKVSLQLSQLDYTLPKGISIAYFDLSNLSTYKVSKADYEESKAVRAAAVSNKFHILTLVMFPFVNATSVAFNLTFGEDANRTLFRFSVNVDTMADTASQHVMEIHNFTNQTNDATTQKPTTTTPFVFKDLPQNMQGPHKIVLNEMESTIRDGESLPSYVQQKLQALQELLDAGELTMKGLLKRQSSIIESYHSEVESNLTNALVKGSQQPNRHLLGLMEEGFLPWEKDKGFINLVQRIDKWRDLAVYQVPSQHHRHILDVYAQSLQHVNELYNMKFGHKSRKVPGHAPFMIDKVVIEDLQQSFQQEWELTSSHRIRSRKDMQYAFSYFYYLMDSKRNNSEYDFLEEMDIDNSKVLSDRELRTLATRIYSPPLSLENLQVLENMIINCSRNVPLGEQDTGVTPAQEEVYYEKQLPQVTLPLLHLCEPVMSLIRKNVPPKPKYKFETLNDEDISFKMIQTNATIVVGQLDDIRRHPKKFICLNDNIDHSRPDALQVKALLADFYESMFPLPSQFELPRDYRNRFLHVGELNEWLRQREIYKVAVQCLLVLLILYTLYSFYTEQTHSHRTGQRRLFSKETV